jgi:UDP-N-acetylglucosamine acyltransferase
MTSGHIAHNCRIGSETVIASCSLIAGYVEIEDQAFISGEIAVHQFSRIGRLAMIAGGVRVNMDAPPFFLYGGLYITPNGLNKVGLRRAGFTRADTDPLKTAYQLLYRSNLKLEEALRRIETDVPTEHTLHLVEFIRQSKRGISRE